MAVPRLILVRMVAIASVASGTIACIGDSITLGEDDDEPTYPNLLRELVSEYVVGFGDRGSTAQFDTNDPYVETEAFEEALNIEADIYVAMLGTNDAKVDLWNEEKYVTDYVRLLSMVKGRVIVVSPPPLVVDSNKYGSAETSIINTRLRDVVELVALENDYDFADVYRRFRSTSSDDSFLDENYYVDGLHPNGKGNEIIAETVRDVIVGAYQPTAAPTSLRPTTSPPTTRRPTTTPPTVSPSQKPSSSMPTKLPTTQAPTFSPTTAKPADQPTIAPSTPRPSIPLPSAFPSELPTTRRTPLPSSSAPSSSFPDPRTVRGIADLAGVSAKNVGENEKAAFEETVGIFVHNSVAVTSVVDASRQLEVSFFVQKTRKSLELLSSLLDVAILNGNFDREMRATGNRTALNSATILAVNFVESSQSGGKKSHLSPLNAFVLFSVILGCVILGALCWLVVTSSWRRERRASGRIGKNHDIIDASAAEENKSAPDIPDPLTTTPNRSSRRENPKQRSTKRVSFASPPSNKKKETKILDEIESPLPALSPPPPVGERDEKASLVYFHARSEEWF